MTPRSITLTISPTIGKVSGIYMVPNKSHSIMTLAHGAGAGMDHAFMTTLATELANLGVAPPRFNFPFTEHKKGRPDSPAVAHQTIAAAITHAHTKYPNLPLFA